MNTKKERCIIIPVVYFRSTSLKTWEHCNLRYMAEYCMGLRFPSGPAAVAGTVFHEVSEVLAICKKAQDELEPGTRTYEDKEKNINISYEDVNDIDIEKLSKDIYEYHINKIDPARVPKTYQRKTPEASVRAWIPFKKIQTSINNVMAMEPRNFDVRQMSIVATEQKFDIELKEAWSKFDFKFKGKHYKGNLRLKGSIDLIVKGEDGGIELIDWKTSAEDKSYEEASLDLQLAMYYLVCKKYLGLDVRQVTVVYVNTGTCCSVVFDENFVLEKIRSVFEEMQSCTKPFKNDSDDCVKFCPLCKRSFDEVDTLPKVRAREYNWIDDSGLEVKKTYRICGQLNLYLEQTDENGQQLYTPLQLMEILARKDMDLTAYTNT